VVRLRADDVTVQFNNNNRDYPVRNALAFRRLLGQSVTDVPAQLSLAGDPGHRREEDT